MNTVFLGSPIRSSELVEKAKAIYAGRRARDRIFVGLELFAEPAWDILLDLFPTTLEHERISIGDIALTAAIPLTTRLRWLETLSNQRLLERVVDPHDRRRSFVKLTKHGLELITEALIAA